ncbi:helix-turn-helix domain-containing protein [Flagellimonas olearia]|uniref:AraC family transcriptional regulator n=1 Tax=Flagellimonas olearia TaxID=552546 RepID=A0A444VJT1_9FLAO|nr:helix-turn-helix transcriptional regulator [Allomuricauda olearia]RYC51027.1 AraC family transcriptional regulator [Allomuricauda olearia]
MKSKNHIFKFRSIFEMHQAFGIRKPQHPLISITHFNKSNPFNPDNAVLYDVLSFYKIVFVTQQEGRLRYGRNYYDFDEGSMMFLAPNQVVGTAEHHLETYSYILLIHPDFFLGYPLAKKIKQYGYFSYSVNEAIHLSEKEKETILTVYKIIEEELNSRIDEFSQDVVVSQIETLLNYANRFYKRQFVTRKAVNDDLLQKTEAILDDYFNNLHSLHLGVPTVRFLSDRLNISADYLSDMLRSLIGQNTQQFIHFKLIEKAKERLSTTQLTVSEIAYELGFEHPQSFSKLFKAKTNMSPLGFRASFN